MRPAFDDPSRLENHNHVRILHGRQPVSGHKDRTSLHQGIHTRLNDSLRSRIDTRGRLVQDHHRRIRHRRPCDRQKLPLTLGKASSVSFQNRVVSIGKSRDEVMCVCKTRRRIHLFIRRIQFTVPDVFPDRPRKQIRILQHDPKRMSQIGFYDPLHIDAVIQYLALLHIIKPVDQIIDLRFPGPRRPDKRHLLTGICIDRHVMQNFLVRRITKAYIVKLNIPLQFRIDRRAAVFRWMMPAPRKKIPEMLLWSCNV